MAADERRLQRVIILEDDADLRETLCELLLCSGVSECHGAASFGQFVSLPSGIIDTADLVVLDVNLGHGVPSGIDAFLWLRERGFGGRIVFLTGHARSHPLVREARELPGVRVLEKPVESGVLEQLIEGA